MTSKLPVTTAFAFATQPIGSHILTKEFRGKKKQVHWGTWYEMSSVILQTPSRHFFINEYSISSNHERPVQWSHHIETNWLVSIWWKHLFVNALIVRRCSTKRDSQKFRKFHRKTLVLEFLFNKVSGQHRCFHVKFAKFLRVPFFYRIPPVTASVRCCLLVQLWHWLIGLVKTD